MNRLSVRGSLYLLDRLRRMGYRINGLGTLWSLYREQNGMHRKMIEAVSKGVEPFNNLPRLFKTIIPNASKIAEATEPDRKPKNFNVKYTPEFAKLYRGFCEKIIQRTQWQPVEANGAMVASEV